MMEQVLNILTWFMLSAGSALCVIGGIGMIRFPDFYSRTHAAGVTDSGGAGFIILGLMLQAGVSMVTVKLLTVLVFLWLTSPAATHALGKAAFAGGVRAE